MPTIVEICNSALITLGSTVINSLTEDSTEAEACNAKWNIARRAVLNEHTWSFATKRLILPSETIPPAFGYKYKYHLPNDLLRIIKVENDSDYKNEGNRILSNRDSCLIKFVYDNEITESWTASFTDLMVKRMAYELAYTIPRTRSMVETMKEIYRQDLETAKYIDSSEDIPDDFGQFDNSLIRARF